MFNRRSRGSTIIMIIKTNNNKWEFRRAYGRVSLNPLMFTSSSEIEPDTDAWHEIAATSMRAHFCDVESVDSSEREMTSSDIEDEFGRKSSGPVDSLPRPKFAGHRAAKGRFVEE